jgi:glycerol 3-phosphatase-2
LWPGAGALLSVVTVTTGAEPEIVGKPHGQVFRTALRRAGGGKPLVIGDRLDTDVAGAAALGWDSLLVLTGITRTTDIERAPVHPTYVGDDLSALFDG